MQTNKLSDDDEDAASAGDELADAEGAADTIATHLEGFQRTADDNTDDNNDDVYAYETDDNVVGNDAIAAAAAVSQSNSSVDMIEEEEEKDEETALPDNFSQRHFSSLPSTETPFGSLTLVQRWDDNQIDPHQPLPAVYGTEIDHEQGGNFARRISYT